MRGYLAWDDEHLDNSLDVEFRYTQAYRDSETLGLSARELNCLRVSLPAAVAPLHDGDLLAGRRMFRPLGVAPSYWDDDTDGLDNVSFYADLGRLERVMNRPSQTPENRAAIADLIAFWKKENVNAKVRARFDEVMKREMPSDLWSVDSGVIFGLYRLVFSQLDYDKLVQLGLPGLRAEVLSRLDDPSLADDQQDFLQSLCSLIDLLADVLGLYEDQFRRKLEEGADPEWIRPVLESLARLKTGAPACFRDALQLVWFYSAMTGGRDFGRMDVYLGDLYAHDIDHGVITEDEAIELLLSFYRLMRDTDSRDGRIVMGGLGRRNPENADRVSMAIMKAGMIFRELKPEFSLRMYKGLSEDIVSLALRMLADGMTYPLLFNDEASVRAVQNTMHVSSCEAQQYGFFGCGEYVLGHRSIGTPNDIINLAKALEVTLHEGTDPVRHCPHGLNLGSPDSFDTFDKLLAAYKRQVEYFTEIAARHQRLVYDTVRENGALLLMSLLMDDCVTRAKPLVSGGVRYLAGTYETYGNTTVSDSLVAIRQIVYEQNLLSLRQLVEILDSDFDGQEDLRQKLLRCPKFGNDDPVADEMARTVNTHVFETTAHQAEIQGLSSYLVVMINNGANVDLGRCTLATADGRRAFTYLSNGNNPMAGMDHNGLPALLRSLASTRMDLTAGTAQNLKLSKDLFIKHPDVIRDLIDTAFDMGILSLNISVMDRGEMEDAMIHPELHRNLFVRVGGFSARFVNLDKGTQADMLSRALY
jgi:pyruvate-formate lyase